jgi:hypothetical protein
MKVRISLTSEELQCAGNFFKAFADRYEQETMNDVAMKQVFTEVYEALLSSLFNNRHRMNEPNRTFTKEIPASHGLFVMTFFHGIGLAHYDSYVLNKVCGQIEQQLFIQGNFKSPYKSTKV